MSFSQSNPDQPDYIPADVLNELELAGVYVRIATKNINAELNDSACSPCGDGTNGTRMGYNP